MGGSLDVNQFLIHAFQVDKISAQIAKILKSMLVNKEEMLC